MQPAQSEVDKISDDDEHDTPTGKTKPASQISHPASLLADEESSRHSDAGSDVSKAKKRKGNCFLLLLLTTFI